MHNKIMKQGNYFAYAVESSDLILLKYVPSCNSVKIFIPNPAG